MSGSVFDELKYKMIGSGNRLNLLIGINLIVFLLISLVNVIETLFRTGTGMAGLAAAYLAIPPYLPALAYKFWAPFTYMFTHTNFFHIFFNLLWLYWMGRIFNDFLNKRQLTFTYLGGGLAGALAFILAFNTIPAFSDSVQVSSPLIGASASVMAIVAATATLLPDYTVSLILLGEVRLKYVALAYIALDILLLPAGAGESVSLLGGALFGFLYIRRLQAGSDWSKLFQKRSRLKVVSHNSASPGPALNQEVIDRILDKISRSGYESLSKTEKEQLFKASNEDEKKK